MSTSTELNTPLSGHTPVSNLGVETNGSSGKTLSNPPSEGPNADTPKARNDGTEDIAGHRLVETVRAELFVAPVAKNLPDIGEASYGPPPPIEETVHGPDDRVRINNTATYPWRVHASLLITAADNSMWIGTGWFIGPHTLMTAGHVVYIKNSGVPGRDGWVKNIQVMPGRNGSTLPYGSATSTNFRFVLAGPATAAKTMTTAPSCCLPIWATRSDGSALACTPMPPCFHPLPTSPATPATNPPARSGMTHARSPR